MKPLLFLTLLVWPWCAQALEPGQAGILAQAAPLTRASYLEATGGLILVLLLIFGLGWVVKRLGMVPGSKGMVRILGGVSLGGRERALILETEGKRMLVGVAPGQVRLLMRLDEPQSAPEPQAFAEALAAAKTQADGSMAGPEPKSDQSPS